MRQKVRTAGDAFQVLMLGVTGVLLFLMFWPVLVFMLVTVPILLFIKEWFKDN